MPDRIGQILGNYRLIGLLGRGGFAEVYLGEHRRLGTQAAIKVLYAHVANAEENDFLTEARTLAHLEHPHIIRILDFDVQNGTPFIVMGHAPNGTLRQRHPKGTILPLTTVIDYVSQIATALQYAHDQKIIHRDIKPENMLLGRHQEVLLSDFGIALLAQSSRLQSTQTVVGTAAYMAPEQLQGKPQIASDQYALGVVIYEWLSGERPFNGTFLELYSQHLSVPPPALSSKNPAMPLELDQVLQTALAKNPTQRFASIKAFATALEQASRFSSPIKQPVQSSFTPTVLPAYTKPVSLVTSPHAVATEGHVIPQEPLAQHLPAAPTINPAPMPPKKRNNLVLSSQQVDNVPSTLPAAVPSRKYVSKPPEVGIASKKRRISRRAVVAGLAGLALAGGTGAWWYISQHLLEGATLLTYTGHNGFVDAVAWSPDGQSIASGGQDTTVQVWDPSNGATFTTYTGHTGVVNAVAWSPTNEQIASGGADKTVQLWDVNGAKGLISFESHKTTITSIAWSPDGKQIVSADSSGIVQVRNSGIKSDGLGGSIINDTVLDEYIYKGHRGAVNAVVWSPDSQRIASGSADHSVQVWNAKDGSSLYTYKGHGDTVNAVAWSPDGHYIASGSADHSVQVWNAKNGSSSYAYTGHMSAVNAVAWSPDSQRIASVGDGMVHIWNAYTGNTLYSYNGNNSPYLVGWSPDGQYIISAGYDALIWRT